MWVRPFRAGSYTGSSSTGFAVIPRLFCFSSCFSFLFFFFLPSLLRSINTRYRVLRFSGCVLSFSYPASWPWRCTAIEAVEISLLRLRRIVPDSLLVAWRTCTISTVVGWRMSKGTGCAGRRRVERRFNALGPQSRFGDN